MDRTLKSSIQAMQDIKNVLTTACITSVINGDLRLMQRKLGSKKEDVVINTLIFDAKQSQSGVFNINIHVPNLLNQPSANPTSLDNTQPDISRFEAIAQIITNAIDDYCGDDFNLQLHEAGQLLNNGLDWIFNIPVWYNFIRTDKT